MDGEDQSHVFQILMYKLSLVKSSEEKFSSLFLPILRCRPRARVVGSSRCWLLPPTLCDCLCCLFLLRRFPLRLSLPASSLLNPPLINNCPHVSPTFKIDIVSVMNVMTMRMMIKLLMSTNSVSFVWYVFVSVFSYINFSRISIFMQFSVLFCFLFCFYTRVFLSNVESTVPPDVIGRYL